MTFRVLRVLALLGLLAGLLPAVAGSAAADTPGAVLYAPSNVGNEILAYSRVVRLAHSGSANGTLLATFEHENKDGSPVSLVIRRSTDDGASWSTLSQVGDGVSGAGHPVPRLWQSFLFEFPRQLGQFPAGTLLLTANALTSVGDRTQFELWRSTDHGATWTFVTVYQTGGGFHPGAASNGIWEPFLAVDDQGRLYSYFSDERQTPAHLQFLDHVVSTDGGLTWSANPDGSTRVAPGLVPDVLSGNPAERPGMPTVTALPDGTRAMTFEICGTARNSCEVHIKTSADGGGTWGSGPADLGTLVTTTDGRYLGGSPYLTWSPAGGPRGELLLSAYNELRTADNTLAPEDNRVLLVNTTSGTGPWSWLPAPMAVPQSGGTGNCYNNYSPNLLPSVDGTAIRYTAPSQGGPANLSCAERTASANAGVLPYTSAFATGTDTGWATYGGCWQVSSAAYTDTCGSTAGNKSLTGSTGWTDVALTGDVRLSTAGADAGFLFRTTDPGTGTDAHRGYYAGISDADDTLVLGRETYNWTQFRRIPLTGGVRSGTWYHVSIRAVACTLSITAAPADGSAAPTTTSYTDCTLTTGAVGIRDFAGSASWRAITVTAP